MVITKESAAVNRSLRLRSFDRTARLPGRNGQIMPVIPSPVRLYPRDRVNEVALELEQADQEIWDDGEEKEDSRHRTDIVRVVANDNVFKAGIFQHLLEHARIRDGVGRHYNNRSQ